MVGNWRAEEHLGDLIGFTSSQENDFSSSL